MLEVNYNFYYHLNNDFPKEEIIKLIKNKNYKEFMKLYNIWGNFYLPQEAFVTANNDYKHMVTTDITIETNFLEITHCEYECG